MRYKVLAMLTPGEEISGEKISEQLNISRAAVAKHIKTLRSEGYDIDAAPKRGYMLISTPDGLNPGAIYSKLKEDPVWHIETMEEVDSTNVRLRQLAHEGAPEFSVLIAEHQTAGRGRLGRPWFSPAGSGLWMSLLLRPTLPPQLAQLLTLTTATALAEAFEQLDLDVRIKWPNDILTPARKKLCGVRCEMQADMERVEWLVVGLGVNINETAFPPELAGIASSLSALKGESISRPAVAAAILDRLLVNYRLLEQGRFDLIRESWLKRAIGIGETVTIDNNGNKESGIACDLDEEGYLLLEQNGERKRVLAGDMVIRMERDEQ